jgi:GDP-L-fucose synthase
MLPSKLKIFLTGAGGMVGRNILESADHEKYEFMTPSSKDLNLSDFSAVSIFYEKYRPDIVVHAAGKVGGIQANISTPVNFLVENVDIGRNVIMGARRANIKNLLNISSSCMYPRGSKDPLKEDQILKGELEPTNEGYAIAKIFTTKLCEYINIQSPSFLYKTIIPCNLYGKYDKFDPINSHLIPAIIHKIHSAKINNLKTVEIWGDGTARREFMYSGDFGSFVNYALSNFEGLPTVMNVGLGFDYSIEDYYKVVADVVGWNGQFHFNLDKPVGMMRKLVSSELLFEFGWKHTTDLKQGVELTYKFYLKSLNGI